MSYMKGKDLWIECRGCGVRTLHKRAKNARCRPCHELHSEELKMPGEWINYAACRNEDPEIFFSELDGQFTDAVRVCDTCPVTSQCLNYAIDNGEKHGVFGGLTPAQRLQLTCANAS